MPDFAAGHCNLGNALKEQGHIAEAIRCYRQALRIQPNVALAYANLGAALCEQGKLEEALACCRRALELEPNTAAVHCNLGYVLKEQNGWSRPKRPFGVPSALRPNFPLVYSNLGKVLQAGGKLSDAADCYEKMRQLAPATVAMGIARSGAVSDNLQRQRGDHAVSHAFGGYARAFGDAGVETPRRRSWAPAAANRPTICSSTAATTVP